MTEFYNLLMQDPEVYANIMAEKERQQTNIELIASENFVSPAVMEAMGSYLTNKYAEGYPGRRYYGGCKFVDNVEQLAIDRLKKLFGAEYANVQPHSGAQANLAVYQAFLKPGDTILTMSLQNGAHLSHGSPVNQSGKIYNIVEYRTDEKGYIDYENFDDMMRMSRPKLIIAGASAYPREIDFAKMRDMINKAVEDDEFFEKPIFMVDMAHIAGLVAAGLHQSPIPYADVVTSTTHKTLRGPRGGIILCKEEYGKKIDSAVFPGTQGGPLEHIIAAKAVCFAEALKPEFVDYQKRIVDNCYTLANELKERGFNLITGGTDNHLLLIDLRNVGITGIEAQNRLEEINITLNKNAVPNDPERPMVTSGIRIGTAAVTTRGFNIADMKEIARIISIVLTTNDMDENQKILLKEEVAQLCKKHPLYS